MLRWTVTIVLLTACVPSVGVTTTTTSPDEPLEARSSPSAVAEGENILPVLVSAEDPAPPGLTLERISPYTLRRQPATPPIHLGRHPQWALAPDGRTLAVAVRPSDPEPALLSLLDLEGWEISHTGVEMDPWWLHFGHDGRVYWLTRSHPGHPTPIHRYDPSSGSRQNVASLAGSVSSSIFDLRVLPSGTFVVYWAPSYAGEEGWPELLFLEEGGRSGRLELTGVEHGPRTLMAPNGEEIDHDSSPGLAWDVERGRLYVVHGEEEPKVTVVDLENRSVTLRAGQGRTGLLGRLGEWLVPTAHAKGASPGISYRAVLSPDGSRLYVTGWRADVVERSEGWGAYQRPLGIRLLDTETMEHLARSDLPVDSLSISSDGSLLVGTGMWEGTLEEGGYEVRGSGVFVLEARSLKQLHHLDGVWQWIQGVGFSPDDRYAYLNGPAPVEMLQTLDLEAGELEAERVGSFPAVFGEAGALLAWRQHCPTCPGGAGEEVWPFRLPEGYGPDGRLEVDLRGE